MALVVLGLIPADWNSDFIGGDMLWLAVLFITTGLISSSNIKCVTTILWQAKFVSKITMNAVRFAFSAR
jgi:hypothetical protein